MGPPNDAPNWLRLNFSVLVAKKLRASRSVLRRNSNRLPWKLIASRFRGHQNRRPTARSPFRRVVVSENLEFLDGIDGRQNRNGAGRQFVIIVAIQQPIRAVGARPTHRKRIRPARGRFAARPAIKKAVRVGLLSYARRQRGKLHEIASVQGKIGHLLRGDHLAQRGIRGLDRHSRGAHFHVGLNRGRIQLEIQFAMFVHLQPDVVSLGGLETLQFHLDVVIRHTQQAEQCTRRFRWLSKIE